MAKIKLDTEYNYREREIELLAIIGEAYLQLDGPNRGYYLTRIEEAKKELAEVYSWEV